MALILNSGGSKINPATPVVVANSSSITGLTVGKTYALGGAWNTDRPTIASGATDINIGSTQSLGSGYHATVATIKATNSTVTLNNLFTGSYCQID